MEDLHVLWDKMCPLAHRQHSILFLPSGSLHDTRDTIIQEKENSVSCLLHHELLNCIKLTDCPLRSFSRVRTMRLGDCMDASLGELEPELAEEGTTVREKIGG